MALFEPKLIERYIDQLIIDKGLNKSSKTHPSARIDDESDNYGPLNTELTGILNSEQLCKLKDDVYVICKDYCCGEIWESLPHFCCSNNFKPIRNLFYFLLITFVALVAITVIYLTIENIFRRVVLSKIKRAEDLYRNDLNKSPSVQTSASSSGETTPIDESPYPRENAKSRSKMTKHVLVKHSRLFKDITRMKSNKRKTQSRELRRKSSKSLRRTSVK